MLTFDFGGIMAIIRYVISRRNIDNSYPTLYTSSLTL